MFEELIECIVKRNITGADIAKRYGIVILDIMLLLAGIVGSIAFPLVMILMLFVILLMISLTVLVFRNTDVEYEYSYFDNEMTIDKIRHRSTRKRMGEFNFNQLEFMAPAGSQKFANPDSGRKRVDYSANNEDMASYIAILYNEDNEAIELVITPNEELLNAISKNCPRKVSEV